MMSPIVEKIIISRSTSKPTINPNCSNCQALHDYSESMKKYADRLQLDLEISQSQLDVAKDLVSNLNSSRGSENGSEESINTLILRMEALKKEKGNMWDQIEREEEFLTNNLQKKVQKLEMEKRLLEKLFKSIILPSNSQKIDLENWDFDKLRMETLKYEDLLKQVTDLKSENRLLKQKLVRDEEKLDEISHEKADLALALECDEDRIFNLKSGGFPSSSRKRSTSVQAIQAIPLALSSPKESPSPSRSRTKSAGPFSNTKITDSSPVRSLYGKNWFAKRSQSLKE